MPFRMVKLEWCGYPAVKKVLKICLFVLTESTNVKARQTYSASRQRARLMLASRGKNRLNIGLVSGTTSGNVPYR